MNSNLESKTSIFHDMIDAGQIEEIEALIESGVDVQYIDDWACTPLEHAVEVGDLAIVKILLNAGADMYFGIGSTPFEDAIRTGRIDIMIAFIDAGINLNYELEYGFTFLIEAILRHNLDIVKFLVEKGANINVIRADGKSALMCAAIWGGLEIFNYLFPLSSSEIREQTTKEMVDNLIVPKPTSKKLSEEILF